MNVNYMSINNLNCKLFHNFHLNVCYFILFFIIIYYFCACDFLEQIKYERKTKKRKIGKCQVWKAKF